MTITKQMVADRIIAYLRHEMTLAELVEWSEIAIMEGEFPPPDAELLSSVIGQLGVADEGAAILSWEDWEKFLNQLGFSSRVQVVAAPPK